MAANSTMAVPPTVPETSSTCTESSSVYVPGVPASSAVVPTPSTPAAVTSSAPVVPAVPASSGPAYPAVPASSKPVIPAVPASSSSAPAYPAVPVSSGPAYPAVPVSSAPVVPAVPASSSSAPAYPAVPVSSVPAYPAVPASSKPMVPAVPASSKPVVPAVPVSSTSCTEEEQKPTPVAPKPSTPAAPVAESSKPAYPAVPSSAPAYPAVSSVELPSFTPLVPTSSQPAAVKPIPSSSKPAAAKPTPSSSKPSGSQPTGGSYDHSGHIVTNGDKWSMTYTPYAENGDCKTAEAVAADIKEIAQFGFTTIRSYSTDCGVFENVVPACQEHGLKIIYGIYLEAGGKAGKGAFSDHANQQLKAITDNAPKDSVAMVIVGNEAMFNNYVTPEELASYIDYVRNEFRACGFPSSIAITTTEPVGTWEEKGAALCSHIDVFCAQVHPFFTGSVTAADAGTFALQQLEQAAKVCPDAAKNGTFITETGWPSAGHANVMAIPGKAEQKIAIESILEKVGSKACLLGLVDDDWKAPGPLDVEQHWGLAATLSSL